MIRDSPISLELVLMHKGAVDPVLSVQSLRTKISMRSIKERTQTFRWSVIIIIPIFICCFMHQKVLALANTN